jgi:hypothetical protein
LQSKKMPLGDNFLRCCMCSSRWAASAAARAHEERCANLAVYTRGAAEVVHAILPRTKMGHAEGIWCKPAHLSVGGV